jgi:phospholipid/cholesterol/gamma-HCH transport system substrate-binding protein
MPSEETQSSAPSPPGRSAIRVLALVLVGLAVLALVAKLPSRAHRIHVTVYFSDAKGLKRGAPVRLAGVDVGTVESVRVRPEQKEHPVEARLLLSTSYQMQVPDDSVVRLETAGVFGETFADISSRAAKGHPIRDYAVLKSEAMVESLPPEVLKSLERALQHLSEECGALGNAAKPNSTPSK